MFKSIKYNYRIQSVFNNAYQRQVFSQFNNFVQSDKSGLLNSHDKGFYDPSMTLVII